MISSEYIKLFWARVVIVVLSIMILTPYLATFIGKYLQFLGPVLSPVSNFLAMLIVLVSVNFITGKIWVEVRW